VYYIASKRLDFLIVIEELEKLLDFIEVIPIDITVIKEAICISKKENHKDLEDILQYVCAKNQNCKVIVTNDKSFYSKDIEILNIK
jgi:predicted nucleic acid-binding protein